MGNVARQGGFLSEDDIFGVEPKRARHSKHKKKDPLILKFRRILYVT